MRLIPEQVAIFYHFIRPRLYLETILDSESQTVNLRGYNDSPVENLGSCVVYLHHGDKKYRVLTQIADSKGHMILGRNQALFMGYVAFPGIQEPAVQAKMGMTVKKVTGETPKIQKQINPIVPVIQECTDDKITISDKTHRLSTNKEYLLQEYSDVFQGIGTLPGEPYHIQLKDDYKPVQHPPRQIAVSLKEAYKAELEKLVQLRVIQEVKEHTEWINSIVPVKKPDGSLRLCLDPKDLNKAIK